MNWWVRSLVAIVFLLGVFAVLAFGKWLVLLVATLAAFLLQVRMVRSLRIAVHRVVPILGFGFAVTLLQWFGGQKPPILGLQTLLVYLCLGVLVFLLVPQGFGLPARDSPFHRMVLYLLFVRHFVAILRGEARRVMVARGTVVRRALGPWGMSSLAHALASLFQRCLIRAERFYAAQWLRGLDS
jgi:hypothetical protein